MAHQENTEITDITALPRLSRPADAGKPAPVRIIHLGIGNFARAHQLWYTQHAPDAQQWGVAAFTGRSRRQLEALEPQHGAYTLITSDPHGDSFETISVISQLYAGLDTAALRRLFANPEVVIVTSTVTEAGYCQNSQGLLDKDNPEVREDIAQLKENPEADGIRTIPLRMVAGLLARRQANAGPITVLPCDNLEHNGLLFRRVVEEGIEAVDPSLLEWCYENVDWATSMVDRITPFTTDEDRRIVAQQEGVYDASPVRTEPFREWVIAGAFPAGRPGWDKAGALIVPDVSAYEHRKLWMLNGAHSTLAYVAPLFGHECVDDAVADPLMVRFINEWWDLAGSYLSIETKNYRAQLMERFSNPRIKYALMQIAINGSVKLPVRIVPVALKALEDGVSIVAPARAIAAWITFLHRFADDPRLQDAKKEQAVGLAKAVVEAQSQQEQEEAIGEVLAFLNPKLASSQIFSVEIAHQLEVLTSLSRSHN